MNNSEARELSRELVRGSIIEDAAAHFIAQILEFTHGERIKPLRDQIKRLEAERTAHQIEAAIARAEKAEAERDAALDAMEAAARKRGELEAKLDAVRAERDVEIKAALEMAAGAAQSEADAANKDADDARQRGFGEAASNIRQHAEAMESVMRAIRAITVADVLAKMGAK